MAVRAASPRAPAIFWRDIATPAARISYEELQVVAAELPENLVLCSTARTMHSKCYTGLKRPLGFQQGTFSETRFKAYPVFAQFSETTLTEYLLRRWRAYDVSHFKSAAPTTSPKTKARTAYTLSPKRNATNVVTKETSNRRRARSTTLLWLTHALIP